MEQRPIGVRSRETSIGEKRGKITPSKQEIYQNVTGNRSSCGLLDQQSIISSASVVRSEATQGSNIYVPSIRTWASYFVVE